MGAPCEFKLYAETEAEVKNAHAVMLAEVRRLEAKYSRYTQESVTTCINRAAGKPQAVPIDNETAALLNYAEQLFQQSDGLFDITSGVLRKAWDFKSNSLPSSERLQGLLPLIAWQSVEFDHQQIRLPKPNMEIDFGGFVKEYAADTTAVKAIDCGLRFGLVNLGGDIRALGPHPDGSPWRVGIQHPRKPKEAFARVDLYTGAIATSGDYERYMMVNGKRYCHLLNPNTGLSIQPFYASISVIAEACLIAGSFTSIGLLKSEHDAQWVRECGLPHLLIDTALQTSGNLFDPAAVEKEKQN